MKMDINVTINVEVEVKNNFLTDELMNNYERYFSDISKSSDFSRFKTREEKHIANICQFLAQGEISFIEGYGKVNEILASYCTNIHDIEEF